MVVLSGSIFFFFFSSRRRHTRSDRDWSSDVCSSDLGMRSSTQARLHSSLKRLYRFLARRRRIELDPTLKLDPPKKSPRFPKTLSEVDVEALLAQPDPGTPLGLRDRAMLEVLYASGLRVSELVRLKLSELSFDMGVVRIFGKGSKERLVPLGEEALAWLARYLNEGRPVRLRKRASDYVFVTGRGAPMTRQAFWHLVKKRARSEEHTSE